MKYVLKGSVSDVPPLSIAQVSVHPCYTRIPAHAAHTQEITVFQNHLIQLVQQHPLTRGRVRVVSLPGTPLQLSALRSASRALLSSQPAEVHEHPVNITDFPMHAVRQ